MYRLGLDIGGTSIKIGIVNERHEIICKCSEPTKVGETAECNVERMASRVNQLIEESEIPREEILFMGVGSPGAIDMRKGIVLFSNNFTWENVPLVDMLKERLSLPVLMANDAQCALIGELTAGAAQDCNNVVLLTLGTGVGGSVLADGRLLNYERGGGILGHMVIRKNGSACSCGRKGCLEAYASASALIRIAESRISEHPDSLLAGYAGKQEGLTGKAVFDAAKENDPIAQDIIKDYIENLGEGIANIVTIFRPDKVLIGGGISEQKEALLGPLKGYVYENVFAKEKLYLPQIECTALGNDAGMIGAAALDSYLYHRSIP